MVEIACLIVVFSSGLTIVHFSRILQRQHMSYPTTSTGTVKQPYKIWVNASFEIHTQLLS